MGGYIIRKCSATTTVEVFWLLGCFVMREFTGLNDVTLITNSHLVWSLKEMINNK